jgi:hypothetical protein
MKKGEVRDFLITLTLVSLMVASMGYPWYVLLKRMEPIRVGDRVRYSDKFLETCDPKMLECRKEMEGTVIAIVGNRAQIDLGSHFRASSMVDLANLQKL